VVITLLLISVVFWRFNRVRRLRPTKPKKASKFNTDNTNVTLENNPSYFTSTRTCNKASSDHEYDDIVDSTVYSQVDPPSRRNIINSAYI